jgi:hypothetical protein
MLIITKIVSTVKFLSILHDQIKPNFQKSGPLLMIWGTRMLCAICFIYLFFHEEVLSLFKEIDTHCINF